MRGATKHHDSDRRKMLRAQALRRSIGLAWERVPNWMPDWPDELVREIINTNGNRRRQNYGQSDSGLSASTDR